MTSPRKKQATWFGGLTLLAALLGIPNGVWTYLTEPLVSWMWRASLSAATLGISSVKDVVYEDVAQGFWDEPGWLLLLFVAGGTFTFSVLLMPLLMFVLQARRWVRGGPTDRWTGIAFGRMLNPDGWFNRYSMKILFVLWLALVLQSSIWVGVLLSSAYSARALRHYQQLRTIVAPHVPNHKLLEYDARRALIQNRADYVSLIGDIETEARKHATTLPEFTPW